MRIPFRMAVSRVAVRLLMALDRLVRHFDIVAHLESPCGFRSVMPAPGEN
jgi:hypothetical protein